MVVNYDPSQDLRLVCLMPNVRHILTTGSPFKQFDLIW